jgi:hypothetical protein
VVGQGTGSHGHERNTDGQPVVAAVACLFVPLVDRGAFPFQTDDGGGLDPGLFPIPPQEKTATLSFSFTV